MKKRFCYFLIFLLCLSPLGITAMAEPLEPVAQLPTLFIELEGGVSVGSITKEVQTPATFSMVGEGIEPLENLPITIKGRGNSTWKLPKKPYQIKFESKTDLLGMGASKKWILLANYWDKTHLRNAITYHLANKMNDIFSVEFRFVDVVINGQYNGCYLLCEKIEFGSGRIEENTDDGSVLMELEQQYRHADDGCDACIITKSQTHITLKEPEVDEKFTWEQMELTKELTLAKLNQIETAFTQGYSVYSQMIDVDSFVDWFIQNEIAKNYDAAFVTSSYCYLDANGVLHMGPVWDVDVCFGNQDVIYPSSEDNGLNPYNYRADKGAWYTQLFKDETFPLLLKERWQEIVEQGYIEELFEDIDTLSRQIAPSKKLDEKRWPAAMRITNVRDQGNGHGGTSYFTFEDEVTYLKDWLSKRLRFLHSQWSDTPYSGIPYQTLSQVNGTEIANTYGTKTGGVWAWRKMGSINRKLSSTNPFFTQSLTHNTNYLVTARFTAKGGQTTDAFALRLVGYKANGTAVTLQTTVATQVTYATAAKDEQKFGNLYFAFTTPVSGYASYGIVVDIHSGEGSLGNITLARAGEFRYGDVDEDGAVNAKDALRVLKYAVGKTTLTTNQATAAEVDGVPGISAKDALEILKYTVGKIHLFPIES